MTDHSPFRYFKTSPEIIRLAVMMYVRFPLSLRNVEDLLHERGIDISYETSGNRLRETAEVQDRPRRPERCNGDADIASVAGNLLVGAQQWHTGMVGIHQPEPTIRAFCLSSAVV